MTPRRAALALLACSPLFLIDLSWLPDLAILFALGHVLWFAALGAVLLRLPPLSRQALPRQGLILLGGILLLSASIEGLQAVVGRNASLLDIGLNLLGGCIALAFSAPARRHMAIPRRRALQVTTAAATIIALTPALYSGLDDWRAHRDFPVLGRFEHRAELQRWSRGALQDTVVRSGRHALYVPLDTRRYSGTTLRRNLGDWRGYDAFAFSAFNPGPEPLTITVSIRDRAHFERGTHYTDRFNQQFVLEPGWQDIIIPMAAIATAPAERKLDLSTVQEVLFFASQLPKPRELYLDDIRLLREPRPDNPAQGQSSLTDTHEFGTVDARAGEGRMDHPRHQP